MGLRFATGAAQEDSRGIILDLTEELDGVGNSTAVQTLATINRGNGEHIIPAPTAILSVTVGAMAAAFDAALGRTVRNFVSGAAAIGLASVTYRPRLSPRTQAAGAPPQAILPPALFMEYNIPCRRTVVGTAPFGVGWPAASITSMGLGGTAAGAWWQSDPAVNAGRWFPRLRLVNAGAITDGPDSGVSPADWHALGMRMVEGATPRIEWLLDGVPRFSVAGDANLPELIAALPGGYICAIGVGAPAGSTWQALGARWKVGEVQS